MAKVICTLPNASELISGVKFVAHELGVISEEIADEVALAFTEIQGYVLHEAEVVAEAVTGRKKRGAAAESAQAELTPAADAGTN